MTIDIQWALEHLATKEDVAEIKNTLTDQRKATHDLRDKINVDIGTWRTETDRRVLDLEEKEEQRQADRREKTRRQEDRRRQMFTWLVMLVTPIVAFAVWLWHWVIALWGAPKH